MAFWNRVTSLVAGGAVATAAADGVRPVLEPVRQHAWSRNRQRVLDVDTTARLVAQAIISDGVADDEAARNGYSLNRLHALVHLMQTMPAQAELDRMLNRKTINKDLFDEALAKHQIDPRFWKALYDLTNDKLSVADIAAAVQQGHLPNDKILPDVSAAVTVAGGAVKPVAPDGQPPSSVPLTQINLDPVVEAEADGYDLKRLRVRANLAGLPPGPETLLAMWNRGEIDEDSVDAGIREGHMKTKWAGAYKRFRWAVLSGQEYAEAHLRAWVTEKEMYEGGALTGHTKEQMDLFYKNRGRTATPRQIWLGWARKVPAPDYPGDPAKGRLTGLTDHELAIRRSNIRPEYAKLLWDVRFNYPPLFQLTRLVQSGAIDADQAKTWADYQIYAPEVTAALHAYWLTLGGSGVNAVVKSEQTRLRTATHKSYIAQESDDATARAALLAAGLDAATITDVLTLWQHERGLIRAQLSPGDVRKAYQQGDTNAATGAQWTRDEAFTALLDRGWGATDANDYLNIPYKG